MLDATYTMRCDRCHRYLVSESKIVVEAGEEGYLLATALTQGWKLGDREQDGPDYCGYCWRLISGTDDITEGHGEADTRQPGQSRSQREDGG